MRTISYEELSYQTVEVLPARETLAVINVAPVVVVGVGVAVNVLTENSTAAALVAQYVAVGQG